MFALGLGEWLVILLAVVLLFGPKYIGKLGRNLLDSLRNLGKDFHEGYEGGASGSDSSPSSADSKRE